MSNAILTEMREDDLRHDPWGTTLSYGFAVAEMLTMAGEAVPMDYTLPPFVYQRRANGARDIHWRDLGVYLADHPTGWTVARTALDDIAAVTYAGRVLDRYLDIVRATGRDY